MSTNAVIKIAGYKVCQVYKHWDGYPESTLPWLAKFNQEFSSARSNDPSYKMGQLLRASVRMQEEFRLDPATDTGWGVTAWGDDLGQEYEYILQEDGSVITLET